MTRRSVRFPGMLGALAFVSVAVPASVSFAGTDRVPTAAASRPATTQATTGQATTTQAATTQAVTTQADSFLGGAPAVPTDLVPPEGNVVHAVLKAKGVQVYTCTGGAWTLLEPAASLTGVVLHPVKKVTALHYRGPGWQSVQDGSLVQGNAATARRAPSPHANSIPQLLITASAARGPGLFARVTYIQRLDTVGGVAAGACTGDTRTAVPYRAVYRFFVEKS